MVAASAPKADSETGLRHERSVMHGRVDLLLVHQQHVLSHDASESALLAAPCAALIKRHATTWDAC
jgi:hypothetical protein